jgi:hypothetical protein
LGDWSSDVCSSDLINRELIPCLYKAGKKLMFATNSIRH